MAHVRRFQRALWLVNAALVLIAAVSIFAHRTPHADAEGPRPAAPRLRLIAGLSGEEAALAMTGVSTTTTTAPPPPPTTTTTAKPKPPPPPKPKPAPKPAGPSLAAYAGLGTWSDVFDWSNSYTNNKPGTGPADVDAMAAHGVQTLYIQAARADAPGDLVDPDLLLPILKEAKAKGIRVVGWYLPTLVDPQKDLARILAVAKLPEVDSVAVDIESKAVSDVNDRNNRLVDFSKALRAALPGRTIGAIVLPPVVLEVVNPNYWPNFPYKAIAPFYDVWQTMGYWTNRTQASGYRDAYRYTTENVNRLRADVGRADLPVHAIGGIGDNTTAADVAAFRRAAVAVHAIGGSLYDYRTTAPDFWAGLAAFRA